MKSILLLSGTSEGPLLAKALLAAGFNVRATVTRLEARENLFGPLLNEFAAGDARPNGGLLVEIRGFTPESLAAFLCQGGADLLLDATHPFAVRITRIAREVCARLSFPYVRYERPDWNPPPETHLVDSFAEAASILEMGPSASNLAHRVLLTIGAKQLKHFAHLHVGRHLIARILPSTISVQQALAAGFDSERILCMRPPFSRQFNRAILEEYRIGTLVTKASGKEGGVEEKVMAALDLGVQVVMIRRPEAVDASAVASVSAAVAACLARL